MREMIAGSHGMVRFPGRPADGRAETSPVSGVNVEADQDRHLLVISPSRTRSGSQPSAALDPDLRKQQQADRKA
jgi:hypothetical protein